MASIQTLSDSDRRVLARWALSCAERVLPRLGRTEVFWMYLQSNYELGLERRVLRAKIATIRPGRSA
ncbi:hypothetical protein [Tomitella fengzijianii]|uniref:Uncharacterized protein n=1 Tax=Tomitella fengzijianii TaxID=2597660 RepID=A0A516X281_9ACTN|nr:hypothetical protein [Tomitella fengzijianii]QDQ97182.1 hypothetical protein FO059_07330 [Tomitella fengzijianii]